MLSRQVLSKPSEITRRQRELDLTRADLARRAGISRSLIAKIEVNRQILNYRKAKAVFDVLEYLAQRQAATQIDTTVERIQAVLIAYADLMDPLLSTWRRMVLNAFC